MKNKILENNKNDIIEEIENIVNRIKGKRFIVVGNSSQG